MLDYKTDQGNILTSWLYVGLAHNGENLVANLMKYDTQISAGRIDAQTAKWLLVKTLLTVKNSDRWRVNIK